MSVGRGDTSVRCGVAATAVLPVYAAQAGLAFLTMRSRKITAPKERQVSNHFSAANLNSPGGDPRLDLTDLYVFQSSSDQDKTVLIADFCPLRADQTFNSDAVYRINIDNDADSQADVAFVVSFTEPTNGGQTGSVYYATGRHAREADPTEQVLIASVPVGLDGAAQPVQAGKIRLFAGVRSDPFFADAEGALHGFQWTGVDSFEGKNVLCIALEVPDDMLGQNPEVGVWATVSLWRDGVLVQMDRGGHPTINPFVNPDDAKDEYNSRQPLDDVANYLQPWSNLLQEKGGYSPGAARTAVMTVLPDILRYDRSHPARYPNGRGLTDDVFSNRFGWLTNGRVGPDGLKPHDDLLADFPYLGLPNT
jgi:hypothetical protein